MNILLISTLYPHQAERPFAEITPALHQMARIWAREHRVTVVRPVFVYLKDLLTGKKVSLRSSSFRLEGVDVLVYPVVKIPRIAYLYGPILRFVKRRVPVPDVVVAHYGKSLDIGLMFARKTGLPLVAGIHTADDLLSEDPAPFQKRCVSLLAYSSGVAARSLSILKTLRQWFPEYHDKIFPALSGIPEDWVESQRYVKKKLRAWKGKGDVASGLVKIITVCNLKPLKNIDITLRALAVLKQKGLCRWEFTLIGDGEDWSRLNTLTRDLGLVDQVRFLGRQPREVVRKELARSHIFVMASYPETFGLVYLEAMATGNIVVASLGTGIDGVVRDGENGYLVTPGDPKELEQALQHIMCRCGKEELEALLERQFDIVKTLTQDEAAAYYLSQLRQAASGRAMISRHFLS